MALPTALTAERQILSSLGTLLLLAGICVTPVSQAVASPRSCESIVNAKVPPSAGPRSSDLLVAAIGIKNGLPPRLLSSDLIQGLRRILGKRTTTAIEKPENLALIFDRLYGTIGKDEFEEIVGQQITSIKELLRATSAKSDANDLRDLNRGYGWRLLHEDDKAFKDPGFQTRSLLATGAGGDVMGLKDQGFKLRSEYHDLWGTIAPRNTKPFAFTLTGSDANNLLYDLADMAAKTERGKAEILVFDGVYGAGRGRMQEVGYLRHGSKRRDLILTSPDTTEMHPKDPQEIARLEKLEDRSLEEIRERFTKANPPIGGVLIEPIMGIKGVRFYRPEFMLRLRALCDELAIPIFADEILNGGRTGKFLSYLHYEGFEPDFFTFGKGLLVSGVAEVRRSSERSYDISKKVFEPHYMVTLHQTTESLLKSMQVLKRIRDDGLLEKSTELNRYFMMRLKEYRRKQIQDEMNDLQTRLDYRLNERKELIQKVQILYQKDLGVVAGAGLPVKLEGEAKSKLWERRRSQLRYANSDVSYLRRKLRDNLESLQQLDDPLQDSTPRGIGALIYAPGIQLDVEDAYGRLLLPLTMTFAEVDRIFGKP